MEDWVEPELTLDHILGARLVSDGILRSASTKMGVKSPVPTAMPLIKSCASLPRCAIKTSTRTGDSQRWVIFGPAGVVLSDDTGHTPRFPHDVARVTADGESLLTAQNNTVNC